MKIQSIVAKKNSSNCFINFYNVEEPLIISMDLVLKYKLKKELFIESEKIQKILDEQNKIDAKQTSYNYAAYKPRTEFEVRKKLISKKFSEQNIELAIKFLREFDMIDDKKYAENYVRNYFVRKSSGKTKLINDLISKGIDRSLANKIVIAHYPNDKHQEIIKSATEKKLRTISYKPVDKQKKSLESYLLRQGFDWNSIKSVLSEYF